MAIPRILVVDDDADMRDMLVQYLNRQGFAVAAAATGDEAKAHVTGQRIDLILLDVMLGDESGITICETLRRDNDVPIIIISALSADHHRMAGYRVGADDYVAKPFNPALLLARIRAVIRRGQRAASLSYRRVAAACQFADWQFDAPRAMLSGADGVQVALSAREARLLSTLTANPMIPLTREEIASALDPDRGAQTALEAAESRAIDVLVARLRSKIGPNGKTSDLIRTVRGTGYMLACDVTITGR